MLKKINKVALSFGEPLKPLDPIKRIIIHHTHNPNLDLLSTHKLHIEKFKWAGIGYNYLIEKDGRIFEGRGLKVGAHAKGNNKDSIGIALVGNFDVTLPEEIQMKPLIGLCLSFMYEYDIEVSRVIGHRELEGVTKSCPGELFDMVKFREILLEEINKK